MCSYVHIRIHVHIHTYICGKTVNMIVTVGLSEGLWGGGRGKRMIENE
jgi:hypothetical protein